MRRIVIFVFLTGFILGMLFMSRLKYKFIASQKVLSENIEVISTALPTDSPTPTPSLTPSPTPLSTPTLIPTPVLTASPTPTSTPIVAVPEDLKPLFEEFADSYHIDKNYLAAIADCESHFNRGVLADPYAGMYQFTESTWTKYRTLMGKDANLDFRFGARESIETAAYILSLGEQKVWPACSR